MLGQGHFEPGKASNDIEPEFTNFPEDAERKHENHDETRCQLRWQIDLVAMFVENPDRNVSDRTGERC